MDIYCTIMQTENAGQISNFQSINDGSFRIQIDNTTKDILSLNFSQVSNYDDVAQVIQTAIQQSGGTGFDSATVSASDSVGNDVKFSIKSATNEKLSFVSELYTALSIGNSTDVSGIEFLNGQLGQSQNGFTVYYLSTEDTDDFNTLNSQHPRGPKLFCSVFSDLITGLPTPECVLQIDIQNPIYQEWYDAMQLNQSFVTRTTTYVLVNVG